MSRSEIIVTIIVAILGSSSLTTIVAELINRLAKKNPFKQGTKFCLLFALQTEARRLISEGEADRLEYMQFCEMYTAYKKMGGDGYADELKKQVDEISRITIQGGPSK